MGLVAALKSWKTYWDGEISVPAAKPKPRRVEIDLIYVKDIRYLYDIYMETPAKSDRGAHYILWMEIARVCAEVRNEPETTWELAFPAYNRVTVVEVL
jgi:hypothetical protein